jgi:Fic family protein
MNTKSLEQLNSIDLTITPNKKLNLFLAKKDKVDYIYNTSALEGNAMTYPEVATLLDGITVGGHKLSDELMILNQNNSVKVLFALLENETFDISKATLCTLHKEVAKEEALLWGEFRDANVRIGGTEYIPPSHNLLNGIYEENLKLLYQIKHPVIQALVYFLLNAKTQYFYDGNKRTARLVMNGILLSNGYPMLNIKAKDKLIFNQTMINWYDNDDILKAVGYLLEYYQRQIGELEI